MGGNGLNEGVDDNSRFLQLLNQEKDESFELPAKLKRPKYKFECRICGHMTNYQQNIKLHFLSHARNCPFCRFKTVGELTLKNHILAKHEKKLEIRHSFQAKFSKGRVS